MKNQKTADFKKLLYDWGGYDFGKRKITVFDTTLNKAKKKGPNGPKKLSRQARWEALFGFEQKFASIF